MNNENKPEKQDVSATNVERLLEKAYQPEAPAAQFAKRVQARMWFAAREQAKARNGEATQPPVVVAPKPAQTSRRAIWAAVASAALIALAVSLTFTPEAPKQFRHGNVVWIDGKPYYAADQIPGSSGAVVWLPAEGLGSGRTSVFAQYESLSASARQRPPVAATPVTIGTQIETAAGERRRVTLTDGSVLYLNQNTSLRVDGERSVALSSGEVYVEVSPRQQTLSANEWTGPQTFVVRTPQRQVSAFGTKFGVQARGGATDVLVTQGKVSVSGFGDYVLAGQQLKLGGAAEQRVEPTARATHLLSWTRELMAAAESPLVPGSNYAGGALIAVDPYGQEAKLSLRKYHIDVHIEDGFARTTIDQTYFNNEPWRMEGTFYFPLPPDASLSRLAMYVEGTLMEGGMAEREHARNVYETIVNQRKDPALLEWVDGSTFKMRVFPLEGRQEKRIILSYSQRLNPLYGASEYRFPAGHSMEMVRDWSFHARVKDGAETYWRCESHTLKDSKENTDLLLDATAHHIKPDKDVVLKFYDSRLSDSGAGARFSMAEHEGAKYLMLRYNPQLFNTSERKRRDWVFLFESSGDRDPLLARAQVDVIKGILSNCEHDDTFVILTAGTRIQAFTKDALPATPENVKAGLAFLEKAHLVGALDLAQGLAVAEAYLKNAKSPHLVHVGSGVASIGETREEFLVKRVPPGATYVGIGVGKRWSRSFMKGAAERTGGLFTQINPDEAVNWKSFEVLATLNTPRVLNLKVVDNAERVTFLSYTDALAQGEEACAIAKIPAGSAMPEAVTITGAINGQPYRQILEVKDVAPKADYLPRTWAKLEIDRLLADAEANKAKVIELSKAMYVMSPFTSLLVLETEAMYAQFNVDRGRKDHWALYPCPPKIPIVYEPDPIHGVQALNTPNGGNENVKPKADQVLSTLMVRMPPLGALPAAGWLSPAGAHDGAADPARGLRQLLLQPPLLLRSPGQVGHEPVGGE
jgi:hypothetical protein